METALKKPNVGKIRKKIFTMILPITIEKILQMTAGLVSAGMVGRIDTQSIGASGISTRITQIIWAIFNGMTTGATVYVAQAYGAKDYVKLKKVIQHALLFSIGLVVLLQQIVFWKAHWVLTIFGADAEMLSKAAAYLRIASWGLPFWAIVLIVAGVLQGMGNTKTPMLIAMFMNFVNIIFSYIFIFGAFGILPMGLNGAATGLVIAQVCAALLGLFVLFNKKGILGSMFNKSFFKFDLKQILEIVKVGLPASMESVFWQLAAIILTRIMLSFGDTAFAAHQLGMNAESISYMPAAGFSIAATAFIGQAVGARDRESGKIYLREIVKGSILFTSIGSFIMVFFPHFLLGLLTNQKDVIELGIYYLIVQGLAQIPQNLAGVFGGALRGAGFTKVPMVVAFVGLWGIRVPFSWILTRYFHLNIVAIWSVMSIDLLCRFILSFILYKRKDIYSKTLVSEKMEPSEATC